MPVVSALIVACERILTEQDSVSSLIRISELFYVPKTTNGTSGEQAFGLSIYGTFRLSAGDEEPHNLKIQLKRPDGEVLVIFEDKAKVYIPKHADTLGGLNIVASVSINIRHIGMHIAELVIDDVVAARVPLTLSDSQPASR
jgi:hypothetical protein